MCGVCVQKLLELEFTFVYKEICEVLPSRDGTDGVRYFICHFPFVRVLLRVELNTVDGVQSVLEAGHELQTFRVLTDSSHSPIPVQTR